MEFEIQIKSKVSEAYHKHPEVNIKLQLQETKWKKI